MRYLLTIILIISALLPSAAVERIADEGMAREYCDASLLQDIEGIWEYPDDMTEVLIKRHNDLEYDIIVISSPDCRLTPGDVLGSIRSQADPTRYEMNIYREKRKEILSNAGKCTATLDSKKGAIFIETQKLKLSVGRLWFLPKFWRSINIGFSNPTEKQKKGLIKIYPETPGREKRYL
jgi:hypothetical protein